MTDDQSQSVDSSKLSENESLISKEEATSNKPDTLAAEAERTREGSSDDTSNSNTTEFKDTRESIDQDLGSSLSSSVAAVSTANEDSNRNSIERDLKEKEPSSQLRTSKTEAADMSQKSGESSYEDLEDNNEETEAPNQVPKSQFLALYLSFNSIKF